jgi:GntR family transcriptional regulator, carbon starvation induced regulator
LENADRLMDTRPSAPTTLTSAVYERLRRDILVGRLAPGEKLRIDALRAAYEVGASPLREALNRLSAEGLVTQEDQRGFRVSPVSIEDLKELTRTRCWLNEVALRESITQGGTAWEERVVLTHHRLARTPVSNDPALKLDSDWERRHREFHAALLSACGSRWLTAFCESLFDQADRYRCLSRYAHEHRDFVGEHRAIMEATLARDTELAVRLLKHHVSKTAELVASLQSPLAADDGPAATPAQS